VKEQILSIIAGTPTSTRGVGAALGRRRVDVANVCRQLQAEGAITYDALRRKWRIPEPAAAAPVPQAVEPPAHKRTTDPTFAPVEVINEDGVRVVENAPGVFTIACPSRVRQDVIDSINELVSERLEDSIEPLTATERRKLRRMLIHNISWGAL
jgi:hypothetical protein